MTVQIPPSGGVPGISGPPDWFNAPPTGSFRLDDVRWRGAVARTFGGGASQSASLRATQATVAGQQFIYLSFRAAFVQQLSDQDDMVYLGLQRHGGAQAMVIRMQVHGPAFTHTGPPPDGNPPANIQSVQISTLSGAVWTVQAMSPTWINANARAWLQNIGDVPLDPNNRWAIQLRIPVASVGNIDANGGPNLGADFDMWYVIHGSSLAGPVILADYRTAGTTTEADLLFGNYPVPAGNWDRFQLTSGPATNGGVSISWGDVVVQNTYGEGSKIANGANNTFVARPRNYTPNAIPAGDINATFRIANWGSIGGDANQVDFATGVWDYVRGNSETTPVISNAAIPALPAGNNPPATSPIALTALMNLAAGKSLHQCILVTLSGTNLTFLNDSIFQNMNFDHTSLLVREAQISIVGLKPFSPQPRDVYLALEKVNMPRNAPGTNEGRLLEGTMARLMKRGGPLAAKLKSARTSLSDAGDFGSRARLEALLKSLREALAQMEYRDIESGLAALEQFLAALGRRLTAVKQNEAAAKRLAAVFDARADWLTASAQQAAVKLDAFISQLNQWLLGLGNDPASLQLLPPTLRAFAAWLATLEDDGRLHEPVQNLFGWFQANRPATQLPSILNALRESLASISTRNTALRAAIASFSSGTADWLRGNERLDVLVGALSDAGLTTEELDELFPTLRVHVYHDTGERVAAPDGTSRPVLRAQSSFGLYTYHEGGLEGWQTSIQGAQRIADNLYLLAVPNNGTARVTVRVQAVEQGDERIPDDPIKPYVPEKHEGCLSLLHKLLGHDKK